MASRLSLGDITVNVIQKDIKNVHLSVLPPRGEVRLSAPLRMSLATIRLFAIAKLGWIRRQQRTLREQDRESAREYLNQESHYVWGRRYLLKVVEDKAAPTVRLRQGKLELHVRPGADRDLRESVLADWYRGLLKAAIPPLIAAWEPRLKVEVGRFYVQQMKTKWGSCNPVTRSIRLNTELAKKPRSCLEYIVLHEMVHLLDATHGAKFVGLMDRHMLAWRESRNQLNRLPVRHEQWGY